MSKAKEIVLLPRRPVWKSERDARKATLNRLAKAANIVAEISCLWDDVDMSIVGEAEGLIEEIRVIHASCQQIWAQRDEETDHV